MSGKLHYANIQDPTKNRRMNTEKRRFVADKFKCTNNIAERLIQTYGWEVLRKEDTQPNTLVGWDMEARNFSFKFTKPETEADTEAES